MKVCDILVAWLLEVLAVLVVVNSRREFRRWMKCVFQQEHHMVVNQLSCKKKTVPKVEEVTCHHMHQNATSMNKVKFYIYSCFLNTTSGFGAQWLWTFVVMSKQFKLMLISLRSSVQSLLICFEIEICDKPSDWVVTACFTANQNKPYAILLKKCRISWARGMLCINSIHFFCT